MHDNGVTCNVVDQRGDCPGISCVLHHFVKTATSPLDEGNIAPHFVVVDERLAGICFGACSPGVQRRVAIVNENE